MYGKLKRLSEELAQAAAEAAEQELERRNAGAARKERTRLGERRRLPTPEELLGQSVAETIQELPFELLPPGAWDVSDIIEHYRRAANNPGSAFKGEEIDLSRLEQFRQLRPKTCYVGKLGWHGYVVFTFDNARRVALECLTRNNATYILSEDWEAAVGCSKRELRNDRPEFRERIYHRGDWPVRIRSAIWW